MIGVPSEGQSLVTELDHLEQARADSADPKIAGAKSNEFLIRAK